MTGTAVTVVIATLDEEVHVRRAVESASSLGPVFVVDAFSSDATQEIATTSGATVVEHEWRGYSDQKNWALDNLPIETDWVLFLDADEYLTPELVAEIRAAVGSDDRVGFYLPRMNIFMGRPLKHAWWYPDHQLRLFRRDHGRYESRAVHESVLLDGPAGFLANALQHENLKGIDAFLHRHLRYAELEAAEMLRARRKGWGTQRPGRLLGTWPERRRYLKVRVWYRLPGRPVIRFIWIYFIKRGFLDGRAGLSYASLLTAYEILIDAKLAELRRQELAETSAVQTGLEDAA